MFCTKPQAQMPAFLFEVQTQKVKEENFFDQNKIKRTVFPKVVDK